MQGLDAYFDAYCFSFHHKTFVSMSRWCHVLVDIIETVYTWKTSAFWLQTVDSSLS